MEQKQNNLQENILKPMNGLLVLFLNIVLMISLLIMAIYGIYLSSQQASALGVIMTVVGFLYFFIIGPVIFSGIRSLKPNEAVVLTLFGKYYGTIKEEGIYFVNPFSSSFNPASTATSTGALQSDTLTMSNGVTVTTPNLAKRKISLKAMTLNNNKQKVNDLLGNPIIIGIVVIWRVVNTAKAVFNVDNYTEFLSIQADSALRDIVRTYPYDIAHNDYDKSLRSSSQEVADDLQKEIQSRVDVAGLEILDARITNLAYSSEIASAMLQRQQASAIIDAKQMIVDGAVTMVDMALEKLENDDIVTMDPAQKAQLVSNLLVVLVGSKDVQPVIHSDSNY